MASKESNELQPSIFGNSTLKDFTQNVFKQVVQVTQKGNSFTPLLEEFAYWSSFPDFSNQCQDNGNKVLNDIGELFRHHAVQCGWVSTSNSKFSTDLEERFERLVDANDIMLENVGTLLDEANGIKIHEKPLVPMNVQSSPIVSSWNKRQNQQSGQSSFKLLLAKNIQRPQLKWLDKIDNSNTPFTPYLKSKPNAIKPLEEDEVINDMEIDAVDNFIKKARKGNKDFGTLCRHPYEYEISVFEPSEEQLERKDTNLYGALDETDFSMVDTEEEFQKMFDHLKEAKEIAIDLEHHSYRSFQGFVCLMQISTRRKDFIVDTLVLRDVLHVLNEIFTDPNILKVLHGADMDIGWLMRDFGLYIVNMFDTGQAARTLQEDRFSLAYLLKKHCDVDAQKQYQLADWRIRPLPEEMVRYAREDTHFLLYIYDCMRNQLIDRGNETKNLLRSVYSKSSSICSTLYERPRFYQDSHLIVYDKYRGRLNQQQLECFRLLYEWRDKISRQEDESLGYTLPNHMMFQIAENLPREATGVIGCCNPVPPLVKQHLMDIHRLVLIAREYDPAENIKSITDENETNRHGKEAYPTDISTDDGKSGFEIYQILGPAVRKRTPAISAFEEMVKVHLELTEGKKKARELLNMLVSPFQQYLPNTGAPLKHPNEINKAWQSQSKQVVEILDETNEKGQSPDETIEPVKRKYEEVNQDRSIRDMMPKKKKKDKVEETSTDTSKLTSEETPSTEYVPFDYSKADMKKFGVNKKASQNLNIGKATEEVRKGKTIKTKVKKSGARSMSYQ